MVRVTLKQVVPLAFIFATTVIAHGNNDPTITLIARADSKNSKDESSAEPTKTAEEDASSTEESSEATSTEDSKDESSSKDSKSGDDKSSKSDEKATSSEEALVTDTWKPKAQATVAPDLNGANSPLRDPGFLSLSVAFSILTLGMAMM